MTERNDYFETMKRLAREKRVLYSVQTTAFGLREVRAIYRAEKLKIDAWKLPSKVKAVYMCEDDICSVALQPTLPPEPKLFALVHELKHHYCDQDRLNAGEIKCGDYNANEVIEIGAEVFAAELIYPEEEFRINASAFRAGPWVAEDIVRFKKTCGARVSYTFIQKRLELFSFIIPGQFRTVQFKKLEEHMYGVPFYKLRASGKKHTKPI
jgi:Zn-dependent peptidase ImmA (M78 family)